MTADIIVGVVVAVVLIVYLAVETARPGSIHNDEG